MGSDTTDEPKLVQSNFSIMEETTYVGGVYSNNTKELI